jgi:prepilin-type N-terminal cleavage/methylation domain-containing protein
MSTEPRSRRTDRSPSDRGFTLTEVLIVIAVVSIVGSALAASMTVFLRNERSVSARVTETRDLQRLVDFLPYDVASARVVDINSATGRCGSGGSVLLDLAWFEEFGSASYSNAVTYWLNGGTDQEIVRMECENGGSPVSLVVAKAFTSVEVSRPVDVAGVAALGAVEFELVQTTGTRRIVLTSRNFIPAEVGA